MGSIVNVLGGDAQARVIVDVLVERERQDAKWGVQSHAPAVWMLIIGEEVGEAAEIMSRPESPHGDAVQAMVEAGVLAKDVLERRLAGALPMPGKDARARYRAELVQVAASAVAAIECLDRQAGGEP